MKRLFVSLLCVLLLCGCSNSQPVKEDPADAEIELTGNIFLDAEQTGQHSSGGGVIRMISIEKAAALEASQDMYSEFLENRLSSSFAEAYALRFDDGTGVLYYGCDPSNAVYGSMDYKGTILEAWGMILPAEDGTYFYQPYTE